MTLAGALAFLKAGGGVAQELPDLVTPEVLRVCADPADLPFSNRKGDGFENKIAEIVAAALKVPLRYYWLQKGPGFITNTLGMKLCDVIIGYPVGAELVLHTSPYYRSTYVLLAPRGTLAGVTRLSDPALKGKRIGIIAGTPPGDHLAANGLIEHVKPYSPYLLGADRSTTPASAMVADLVSGALDVAVLWGPAAGGLARQAGADLDMVPLLQESERPALSFRIGLAVRPNEHAWKRTLDRVLRQRRVEIAEVLQDYKVPLIDDENRLIDATSLSGSTP
jgi:quinoprotein dehydrogenase-associated probable ABC transporter substrate-binding protein